jgi:dihydrofolate reductase
MSIDGYGAGPHQSLEHPLGIGGLALHDWAFKTRTLHPMHGKDGGTIDVNDDFVARWFENIGAWIIGRNMFGPLRGLWPDESWKGWRRDTPPYHTPVFVLTHHSRNSLTMNGRTAFHFVTDGIRPALEPAFDNAEGKDVRLGGGVSTIRQYLNAGHHR